MTVPDPSFLPVAPLKVLHVISGDLWAGAEVQAFTLISTLGKQPDIQVAAAVMNEGELATRLRGIGTEVSVLDERHLSSLQIIARLREVMDRWRPDIVHTHRSKENVLGSMANRLGRNVPSIRTAHGANERAPRGMKARVRHGLIGALDKWCGRHAQERVIAVSSALAAQLASDFPAQKIVVIENGVDPEAVLSQRRGVVDFRASAPEARHVGIIGRLVAVKRVDLFLQIAARLVEQAPREHWRFHVLGDGPLRGSLEASARELRLSDLVTFHGHRSDIIACMAALDAIIMCSDHEGLPMTALEAVVLGVPVVAHSVGGLVELLDPRNLVTEHNPQGYQAALLQALEQRADAVVVRARLLDRYGAARNAAKVRAVYEELRRNHSRQATR
jgi:glycosyltransferase involved in cell wall biosynthesis